MIPRAASPFHLLLVVICLSLAHPLAAENMARRPEIPAPLNNGSSSLFTGAVQGSVLDIDRMSRWFTLRVIKAEGENLPPTGSVLSVTCKRNDRDQMAWVRDLQQRQQVTVGVAPGENKSLILTQYPTPPADPKAAAPKERKKLNPVQPGRANTLAP